MMIFLKRALLAGIIFVILLSILQWFLWRDASRKPPKLLNHSYGFFPLYEANFEKTVTMNQPNLLWFSIRIETLTPFDTDLNMVKLKIEAIENDQVIGSKIIHGDTFKRWRIDELEPKLTNRFDIVRINQKNGITPKNSLDCFKYQERCSYRITIVQPCEKYDNVITELWATKCN